MRQQGGFTLIETLFALIIFTLGIVSILSLQLATSQAARTTPNRLLAILLADEALSRIQNIRDSNLIAGNAWDAGLSHCYGAQCVLGYRHTFDFNAGCSVWRPNSSLYLFGGASNSIMRYHEDIGYFQTNVDSTGIGPLFRCPPDADTDISRVITIDNSNYAADGYIEPIVTVSWQEGGNTKNVTMRVQLYEWLQP